jgi:predicted phosphate transport protein (TIGR00153 family)
MINTDSWACEQGFAMGGSQVASISLFSKTKELEVQTEEFCDKVADGMLAFKLGVNHYLDGDFAAFDEKKQQVHDLESRCDELRRQIQRRLYVETLIPESRADVLELLEYTDEIINSCESAMWQFDIERPVIAKDYVEDFSKVIDSVAASVEALVIVLRAFFHGREAISDHMHKVSFFETEADNLSHTLMAAMFGSDMDLAHKNQMRHFILHIDNIADVAEDVSDRLAIFALKRAI